MPARRAASPPTSLPPYEPQLATLVPAAPPGDDWLHEVKHDGWRMGLAIEAGAARLWSRRAVDFTKDFPEIIGAVAREVPAKSALLDGELVVLRGGVSTIDDLQEALSQRPPREGLAFLAFDLLWLDGEDFRPRPLEERKARLRELLGGRQKGTVLYLDHIVGHGPEAYAAVRAGGAEGIVSKLRRAPHRAGESGDWQKVREQRRAELVVGGFLDPGVGPPIGIGALLLGYHEDGALHYCGSVGTGFTERVSRDLRKRLEPLVQPEMPFAAKPEDLGPVHWVRPELVAEVAYNRATKTRTLRHASFKGLRPDKVPADCTWAQIDPRAGPRPAKPPRAWWPRKRG